MSQRSPEQEKADKEQQMVGTDQDVVDACRYEFLNNRPHALPRPDEVFRLCSRAIENKLRRQIIVLIHIDERLMLRIVGEHEGPDDDDSWGIGNGIPQMQAKRLAVGKDLRFE